MLACQYNKNDNYCRRCGNIISNCSFRDHHDHYSYPVHDDKNRDHNNCYDDDK